MRQMLVLLTLFLSITGTLFAQRTVAGKVSDEKGDPIAGVSVVVKGATTGTTTNESGDYTISLPEGKTLVFSALGFKTFESAATGNSLNVTLQTEVSSLEEIVVTGYTTQIKKKSAGSSTVITADKIENVTLGSFDQALQGMAPGLSVTAPSGQPGAAASVQIRGKGSILGSNTPLYIVDGIQINASDFSTLNPGDFASISVLKDASATAIYGSRGANGVLVITTKKGQAGKVVFNYDGQYGISKFPTPKLKVMNSVQKLDYELNTPSRPYQDNNPYEWTPADVEALSKINTNWQDVLFHTGQTNSHQLSASGGKDNTKYYLSGSYFDQTGTVKETRLKRYTARFNIESGTKNLTFGLNTQFGYSIFNNTQENDAFIGSPLNAIRWANPYETPFDADGNYSAIISGQPNPLQEIEQNKRNFYQIKGIGNFFVQYNFPFLKGLTFRTNWGADFTQDENNVYLSPETYQGSIAQGNNGSLNRRSQNSFRYTGTTSLSYTTKINSDHELTVGLFQEFVKQNIRSFGFTGYGLTLPYNNEFAITPGNATNGFIPTVVGNGTLNALSSFFADVNYGYKGKYYLNLNARRDGSSRFSSQNRYANFGSIGASWLVSAEDFLQNAAWINTLRYKISYGTVGNQEGIADFGNRSLFGRTTYAGASYYNYIQYGNMDLRWETKRMFNTGIDFELFNRRLTGSVEYYNNNTVDLFIDRTLSLTSGVNAINYNLGKLQNSGIEVGLNGTIVKTRDFEWDLGVNFTYNRNRVKELYDGKKEQVDGMGITKVGSPINSFYLVRAAGVDPQTGEQLYYNLNKTTSPTYDPNNKVVIGTSDAPYFGGVTTSFRYKGLELSALMTYAMGNYIYNNDRVNLENPGYFYDNLSVNMLREWRSPGDITDIPDPNNTFIGETDRFIEKGDFLRLRNVTLSYSLPKSILGKAKISSTRIFIQGINLLTVTDYTGYDPEISTSVLNGAQYPALRQFTFGVNIGF